jgi:hypothetical protein
MSAAAKLNIRPSIAASGLLFRLCVGDGYPSGGTTRSDKIVHGSDLLHY